MSTIVIVDLNDTKELDAISMAKISGGFYKRLGTSGIAIQSTAIYESGVQVATDTHIVLQPPLPMNF